MLGLGGEQLLASQLSPEVGGGDRRAGIERHHVSGSLRSLWVSIRSDL